MKWGELKARSTNGRPEASGGSTDTAPPAGVNFVFLVFSFCLCLRWGTYLYLPALESSISRWMDGWNDRHRSAMLSRKKERKT